MNDILYPSEKKAQHWDYLISKARKERIGAFYIQSIEKHGLDKIDEALEYILLLMLESPKREDDAEKS